MIIGAGAAGLMCAITAGQRGRRVLVLDHANKAGKKILMSGGGRCNFTNLDIHPSKFLSHNPHFCKSALARYTHWDFIALVSQHEIPWHEKKLGQLFCDHSSKDIVEMLLNECQQANVTIRLNTPVETVEYTAERYQLNTVNGAFLATSLVVATGGLSIPRMGATGFGYQIAKQFGLNVLPTRAGLVPFTLSGKLQEQLQTLSGVAIEDTRLSTTTTSSTSFIENLLFTHRGLSGPAVLQLSSYWQASQSIDVELVPAMDWHTELPAAKQASPNMILTKWLTQYFPRRFAEWWMEHGMADELPGKANEPLQHFSQAELQQLAAALTRWRVKPSGTEGYRTAEVTLGGVDTDELSSTTMESKRQKGLYFIGEVVDVTGWLGGYNFQWAWASGHAAGEVV